MRLREHSENIPKPMVTVGYRPILWHVMKYYAHFGHKDFVLCLGYNGHVIKNYFRNYDECLSNDFVLSEGAQKVDLLASDIHDWRITFVDTGFNASIGERLRAVRKHLDEEEVFLANYSDGLADIPLPHMLEWFSTKPAIACFAAVRPTQSFHLVSNQPDGSVTGIRHISESGTRINGGFFIFRREIFDHIKEGDELVGEPFQRLIKEGKLYSYPHDGFWACMDTFKEKQIFDEMYLRGETPWEVWKR
jgi:glucose-1-phosphate cytidylyltransferase